MYSAQTFNTLPNMASAEFSRKGATVRHGFNARARAKASARATRSRASVKHSFPLDNAPYMRVYRATGTSGGDMDALKDYVMGRMVHLQLSSFLALRSAVLVVS